MTHFALALTLVLLAITGYLAWEGQLAAQGAREKLQIAENQLKAQETATPPEASRVLLPKAPATASVTPPKAPAGTSPRSGTALPEMAGADTLPGGGLTVPKSVITAEAAGVNTNTLTPLQKQVLASKPIAKVKTVVKDQGFIVIDAGSKQQITKGMKLDIRRDSAVLGKATVTDTVEESEAVADLDIASIPTGVSIEPGDELIQPVGR